VFAERFNSGDLDAVADAYEAGAVFSPEPGVQLTGAEALAAHRRFMDLGLPMSVSPRHVYTSGDVALLIVDWFIAGMGRDGTPLRIEATATDVARRGPDGRWRYVLDNPVGVGPGIS
jgi:ketosteroid isomerase-like protein